MKSSILTRLITAFIAIPILVAAIVLMPQYYHPFFFLIILAATVIGTYEMKENVLSKKGKVGNAAYLSILFPIAEFLEQLYLKGSNLVLYILAIVLGIAFIIEIFKSPEDNFTSTLDKSSRTVFATIYPGFFTSFVVKLLFLPNSTAYIILYFALVFCTDSFAYFFGMAFGKNNRGIFKVSPNKSVAGFIGGMAVPTAVAVAAPILFADKFAYSPIYGILLGLATSIFSCAGDLIESTFKRSAGIKDSGTVIPGRGGMLDSLDSLMIAAPVYLFFIELALGA